MVAYSDIWYEMPLPHRVFDIEGNLLRPEKPHAEYSAVAEPVVIRRWNATPYSDLTRNE